MKYTLLATHLGVATLTEWHKEIGQLIQPDELVATLRTSEGEAVTIAAATYGVLFRRCVLVGDALEAGEPIAVLAGVAEPPALPPPPEPPLYLPDGPEQAVALSPIEAQLAQHDLFSLHTAPHQYTTLAVDLQEVGRLRTKAQASVPELSVAPFLVAAVAGALRACPRFRARVVSPTELRIPDGIHIALPQEAERPVGMRVPVVRDADTKSILTLARELAAPVVDAGQGATFTLTLGTAQAQTPILHQPQTAHLYVGLVQETATLCLAHDARAATGFEAIRFLEAIREALEEVRFLFVS